MSAFSNRTGWYLGLSAYWYATSFKWFILLLVILPNQVKEIVPGGEKGSYWGMVFAIGAVWAIIGPSLFGFISDRMSDRIRSRQQFLAIGSAMTAVALVLLMGADKIWVIVVGYLLLQISDDVGTGPYSALIPDLVPEENRGRASGMMGLLTLIGQLSVGIFALLVGGDVKTIYMGIAVVNILCALVSIWTINGAKPIAEFSSPTKRNSSIRDFIRGWIEPWKSRDFFWVWFTRFLNALGFYLVVNYLTYYMSDSVRTFDLGFVKFESGGMATNVLALLISFCGAIGATVAAKKTDKIGRKRVIYIAGTLMAITLVPFALVPDYQVIVALAIIFGIGYGMYLSADWALASDILPDKSQAGKDMGVWQMSNSAVQVFSGAAGTLVDMGNRWRMGGGYMIAFLAAAFFFFLSTVLVRQVKGST